MSKRCKRQSAMCKLKANGRAISRLMYVAIAITILACKLAVIAMLMVVSSSCTGLQPKQRCIHTVLSQYAALKQAGYNPEIWHIKNTERASHPYHVAVKVVIDGHVYWVDQPAIPIELELSRKAPTGLMLRDVEFNEVASWSVKNERR